MTLASILILAFAIVAISIIRAFGNIVGAGGNLSKSLSEAQETDNNIDDERARNNPTNQLFRTICGVLFGVLMLCPILYGQKIDGMINHHIRFYLVSFLVLTEVIVIFIMWILDRKFKK